MLIVQHRREQFHAFNSARIVRRALHRCRLLADHMPRLAERFASETLSPHAALLYPGEDASLLSELSDQQRPDQLVVVDGTWSHAKSLLRQIPQLRSLPRVRLAPASPSRYRIRREPNEQALSSLEATVAALRILEPETRGLDELILAFDRMIDTQLLRTENTNWRRRKRRSPVSNVPRCLSRDLSGVVVAYGEQQRGGVGSDDKQRLPIYWIAQRLDSDVGLATAIEPRETLTDEFLQCLRLRRGDFDDAVSVDRFRRLWREFLRPGDQVVVYHPNTARLLVNSGADFVQAVTLKSIKLGINDHRGTLDDVVRSLQIQTNPVGGSRAADRLAKAVALTRYVNQKCLQHSQSHSSSDVS